MDVVRGEEMAKKESGWMSPKVIIIGIGVALVLYVVFDMLRS
jgi:hypothetical protein